MRRGATLPILLITLVLAEGCIYSKFSLEHKKTGYSNYPSSIAAEHARRKKRRKWALIASPLEIVGGLAIAALAIYAPSEPSMADSPTEGLKDAGKEVLGRLLVATIGGSIALSGVGDGVLGLTDRINRSALIRDHALVAAADIDRLAPPRRPLFGLHASTVLGTDGVGSELGFGFAHWISPTVRLRHAVGAELTLPFHSADRRMIAWGEVLIERAFGREHAGLYPRRSLGFYLGGGWAAIEDRDDAPVGRAGVVLGIGRGLTYRLGATIMPGTLRRPAIQLVVRYEFPVD